MMKSVPVLFSACAVLLTLAASAGASVRVPVPEIDAGSAASALTLLIGGAMLLKDKFRAK